jgi:hypothetical protein
MGVLTSCKLFDRSGMFLKVLSSTSLQGNANQLNKEEEAG